MRVVIQLLLCLTLFWPGSLMATPAQSVDLLALPSMHTNRLITSSMMDITLAGERVVMVGDLGRIAYSDDQGQTWQQAEVPVSVMLTAVDFPTPELGWAVGHDGVILHSRDGGATWQMKMEGNQINTIVRDQIEELVRKAEAELADAEEADREDLEYRLEDLGFFLNDAEMAVEEGATRPFMDLYFQDEKYGIVIGSFGIIFRTRDGGQSWEPLVDRMDNPDGFHYYSITRSGDCLFIAGEVGMLFRSDDNGESWQRLDSPYEGSFFGITGHPDCDWVLVTGLGGYAFVSIDRGESWRAVNKPKTSAVSAVLGTGGDDLLLIAYDGSTLCSVDGGQSFERTKHRFPGSVSMQQLPDGDVLVVGLKGVGRLATKEICNQ